MRSKRSTVYIVATLMTMAIFLPFQAHPWAIYAGACAGYTVLVFGLRRIQQQSYPSSAANAKPASAILLTHLSFLALVVAWVWLALMLKLYMPYFLTTEDTGRPYYGLAFMGILGLMGFEAIEQRFLRPEPDSDHATCGVNSAQVKRGE